MCDSTFGCLVVILVILLFLLAFVPSRIKPCRLLLLLPLLKTTSPRREKVVIDLERFHAMLGSFFVDTDTMVGSDSRRSLSNCFNVSAFLFALSRVSCLRRFSLRSNRFALSAREYPAERS